MRLTFWLLMLTLPGCSGLRTALLPEHPCLRGGERGWQSVDVVECAPGERPTR